MQEDFKFKASLSYIARPYLKTDKTNLYQHFDGFKLLSQFKSQYQPGTCGSHL
jgi:hypothetical protein